MLNYHFSARALPWIRRPARRGTTAGPAHPARTALAAVDARAVRTQAPAHYWPRLGLGVSPMRRPASAFVGRYSDPTATHALFPTTARMTRLSSPNVYPTHCYRRSRNNDAAYRHLSHLARIAEHRPCGGTRRGGSPLRHSVRHLRPPSHADRGPHRRAHAPAHRRIGAPRGRRTDRRP